MLKDVSLQPQRIDGLAARDLQRPEPKADGQNSFQDLLKNITVEGVASQMPQAAPAAATSAPHSLKFSNHAVERMRLRGLTFDPQELGKIQGAVDKASAKGAQNTLVLTDKSALIVAIKNNMIVTVMDKNQLKENVFTNIDSTVVI